jgi:DNA-binding NtrC family response regulator
VGSNTYREVDVRVLAATRRDLVRMVNAGVFRSDLYFRIAQVKVEMMALRQRAEDIPILVRKMLKDLGEEAAYERVSTVTLERLMRHDWPGNVRELRNAVAVAHALAGPTEDLDVAAHLGAMNEGPMIEGGGRNGGGGGGGNVSFKGRQFQEAKRDVLARFERDYFAQLADESKGNVSEMARRAGMERAHVRAYLRRHGIGSKPEPGES